jgi:hypothetical protein
MKRTIKTARARRDTCGFNANTARGRRLIRERANRLAADSHGLQSARTADILASAEEYRVTAQWL